MVVISLATPTIAQSSGPIPVVATFSILGDMVKRVGGEHVEVTTLVGANGDAHVYQPTPADARAVNSAQLLFVNGLDFEGWIDRLVSASGFTGKRVVATKGIEPIAFEEGEPAHKVHDHHDHGAFDPHAWQSLRLAEFYVENIMLALAQADPDNAAQYYRNRAAYLAEIRALEAEVSALMATIPENKRTVVTPHDAFQYFAADYGLVFKAPQGLSTESDASASDVAKLIRQIREEGISAYFVETITDNRMVDQIGRETGATRGGTLYSGALSAADGPAATYLDMVRHNTATLAAALGS
ncbi:MAG: metal ABC transporter substrate-binding protein [Alphaproteobacteria bacterium]|nr:metal ABC transporter substrate-binding protein [Alphaproteobacteria bacterium]